MPPKKSEPVVSTAYVFDVIIHQLLVDPDVADYDQIMITVKIGDDISFNLTANRVDCVFQKAKTSHEITVTAETFINIAGLPVNVYFKQASPQEKNSPAKNVLVRSSKNKNSIDENNKKRNSVQNKKDNPEDKGKKINFDDEKKDKQKDSAAGNAEEEKQVDNFGEFVINWQPVVLECATANKFSIHTQFEDKDILKPIIKPEEEIPEPNTIPDNKTPEEPPEEIEEAPRETIGFISMVIKLRVKPESDRGSLADTDGILNVADEIEKIDPNDTIFVIGNDEDSKYEKFLTYCNDNQCPARIDISKFKSIHGRLVNNTQIISPCGNLDCCNECNDNEDCYCDKVISELQSIQKKNFCKTICHKRRSASVD